VPNQKKIPEAKQIIQKETSTNTNLIMPKTESKIQ